MSETARNRLIGVVLLLTTLPLLWVEVGSGMGKVLSFGAGALFGFSAVLVLTGRSIWDSENWWGQSLLERS